MKKRILLAGIGLATLLQVGAAAAAEEMGTAISDLGHAWAKVYYLTPEKQREAQYPALVAQADALARQYPAKAEPMVWQAIILSSYAGAKGGLGALDLAEKARDIAMAAVKIDEKALDAGALTSLGVLYYKVPGWPIGFGSDKKAKEYLDRALAIAPGALDVNYFYGDFMIEQGEKAKAREFLEKALQAPARPGREDADAGRKQEIQEDLAKLNG
ncbi:tetratricopeptide repeat protein [Dongia sp.]|uniref:tetratricopeptide repeat protein n=1 Tax=Dongia sp. TaxID=1977262 RepID=UPI003750AF64